MSNINRTIAQEQFLMAKMRSHHVAALLKDDPWSVADEIDYHANRYVEASVSRNKREGKYLTRKGKA